MKKRNVFVTLGLALFVGLGFASGLKANESKKTQAEEVTYYLVGEAAGTAEQSDMNGAEWNTGSTMLPIIKDGVARTIKFYAGDKFKYITGNSWDNALGIADAGGTGLGYFSDDGGNIKCDISGTYNVSISSSKIYIDFLDGTEFYYSGDENNWDITGFPAVALNGEKQTITLTSTKNFKFRTNEAWKVEMNYGSLVHGDFYGTFTNSNGNILCNYTGDYDVKVLSDNHELKLKIYPSGKNPDDQEYIYVLDKYGSNLNQYHYAHLYVEGAQGTTWPGASMSSYEGTTHLYQINYWVGMETVIFNNKHGDNNNDGYQSWNHDLATHAGKCLILDGHLDTYGKWDSNTWVAPQTAKFIENFMHFQDFDESDETDGTACKGDTGYYKLAKDAYEAASFTDYREELCTLDYVVERLQAWAVANGKTFTVTDGVGVFSARPTLTVAEVSGSNTMLLVVIATSISLISLGGFFFLRKRKEDR